MMCARISGLEGQSLKLLYFIVFYIFCQIYFIFYITLFFISVMILIRKELQTQVKQEILVKTRLSVGATLEECGTEVV